MLSLSKAYPYLGLEWQAHSLFYLKGLIDVLLRKFVVYRKSILEIELKTLFQVFPYYTLARFNVVSNLLEDMHLG